MRLIDADELTRRIEKSYFTKGEKRLFSVTVRHMPTANALKDITEVHCNITKEQFLNMLRPQGGWEKIGEIGLAYKCNKCGEVNVIPTNFCPNCGADMRKGGVYNG